jgi:predicted porin
MKNNKAKLLAVAVAMGMSAQASAEIKLYDHAGTTFSADGHINVFYTHTDDKVNDEEQSRVRMGFLPNYIGFNASKQMGDLKLGARSSFWVTINDGGSSGATDTAIDVRQFYGTVDADWGQVLFGKDFGLYGRSNIFLDELLLGTGLPMPNTGGVTFGNISTGYPYATPVAQITYRSPDLNGFKVAVGVMDPDTAEGVTNTGEDLSARFEGEVTYNTDFDGGAFTAWVNAASGENNSGDSTSGIGYGARVTFGGLALTASGFDSEGISATLADTQSTDDDDDADGYLLQASYTFGANRLVLSHSETDTDPTTGSDTESELNAIALFHKINDNLQVIVEYDNYEQTTGGSSKTGDIDQFVVGAVLSW